MKLFVVCIYILQQIIEMQCVGCDNRTSFIWYQRGENFNLQEFRVTLDRLSKDFNEENGGNLYCKEDSVLCVKTGKCVEQLIQKTVTNETETPKCSMLIYQPCSTTLSRRSTIKNARSDIQSNGQSLDAYGENTTENSTEIQKPTVGQVWGFGILSVGLISLSGLFGALLWPLMKTDIYAQMMWVLVGLAVGSLTASSTFQLIPEGFALKEFNDEYLTTALCMWFSFWVLYMFESLSQIFFHGNDEKNERERTTIPGSAVATPVRVQKVFNASHSIEERSGDDLEMDGFLPTAATKNGNTLQPNTAVPLYMSQTSLHSMTYKKTSHLHSHGKKDGTSKTATVAWMIIIGDGIHNFIDGMSIGAGFSKSIAVGTSISIAIACEEFPHELGDFAILINSGMSIKKALLYNFLSACTAFVGLIFGILLGEIDGSVYIFAFAGGLFLYIALTDLMPELKEMLTAGLVKGKKAALFVLLLQNIGIFTGATILYLVTYLPQNII